MLRERISKNKNSEETIEILSIDKTKKPHNPIIF